MGEIISGKIHSLTHLFTHPITDVSAVTGLYHPDSGVCA